MTLSIFYHQDFLKHNTGSGHPERPERLKACVEALENCDYSDQLIWKSPSSVTEEKLTWIHSREHIEHIKQICEAGGGYLDADTLVCPESYEIAKKSAGAWLDGVEEVLDNNLAFVLSRPPGHHAERDRSMGFCIFSNAALAAVAALKHKGINKVCIFDWDVHHGNGTQNIVQNNPQINYVSTHQFPFYPGTGFQIEKGEHNNVLNVPLSAGLDSDNYRNLFDRAVIPFIQKSSPDLLIISAGFDAHYRDPMASINLKTNDFAYMTNRLQEIQPHLLLGLEGGYDLLALGECCEAVVGALINHAGKL